MDKMNRPQTSQLNDWIDYANYLELLLLPKPKRSASQNKYLHVCISIYAVEYGYTLEEAKTYLKRTCNFMVYEKNGFKFIKQTSQITSEELGQFITWIRNYAGMNGLYIPTAEEYNLNRHAIDMSIALQKQYL